MAHHGDEPETTPPAPAGGVSRQDPDGRQDPDKHQDPDGRQERASAGAGRPPRRRRAPSGPPEPRPEPSSDGPHLLDWACELAGTALLVLGGCSAIVLDFGDRSPIAPLVPSHSLRLLLTGALFAGTAALVTVSPLGRRSGAHLNPVVTFAFWREGHVHLVDLVGYTLSQCTGAIVGTGALVWCWGGQAASIGDGVTTPGRGLGALGAAGVEALMTAVLVLTLFTFLSSSRSAPLTPLGAWAVITVLVWQGAPYTGTSLNPARSLGPALWSGDWHAFWAYLVGPLAGSVAAVALWRLGERQTLTAKLYHDARYVSVLASVLPARR